MAMMMSNSDYGSRKNIDFTFRAIYLTLYHRNYFKILDEYFDTLFFCRNIPIRVFIFAI